MSHPIHAGSVRRVLAAALLVLALPGAASAHSELNSSDPAEGAFVSSPFIGPIVLTFSEHLADGSKADLIAPDGSTVANATVDASAPTMAFTLTATLAPGDYQVKWTSIADDGDLLRGILKFMVAAAATSTPRPSITSAPSPASDGGGSGSDVILPIIVVLIVVAAGAFYLGRRRRPT